ncbi:Trimeric LpxA-like [Phytophthora cactorum]|nr:Trimeric LpxA-like [Phytophthora cactorum]
MASGGGQSPSALAAGLLLLGLRNEQESIPALPVNGSTGNKKILDCSIGGYSRAVCFSTGRVLFPDKLKEFDHARLFDGCSNVLAVLDAIHPYLEKFFANNAWMSASTAENTQTTTLQSSTKLDSDGRGLAEEEERRVDETCIVWMVKIGGIAGRGGEEKRRLIVLPDAHVLGGTFDLSEGRFMANTFESSQRVYQRASNYWSQKHSKKRTYIRGDVIVGRNVVLRGEVKNSVILDDAELCHPGYCGDSICGYDTGRKKMGVILGDGSQLGCSSVTDPCTLIQQNTVVYPLTRLRKGIYGSSLLIKNKPMEKGVLEIVPLRPTDNMK